MIRIQEILTKDFLMKHYIVELMSTKDIAKMIGTSITTIRKYLEIHNIPRRSPGLPYKDHCGEKHYKLTVIKKIGRTSGRNRTYKYLCRCDCGSEKIISYNSIISGYTKSCGCDRRIIMANKKWKGGKYISGTKLIRIKTSANQRGIFYDLSLEYLEKLLVQQDFKCAITKVPIVDKSFSSALTFDKHLNTASLDRIDSSKGYIEGNVHWVHKTINIMKLTMSMNDFIEWCTKVAENNKGETE